MCPEYQELRFTSNVTGFQIISILILSVCVVVICWHNRDKNSLTKTFAPRVAFQNNELYLLNTFVRRAKAMT